MWKVIYHLHSKNNDGKETTVSSKYTEFAGSAFFGFEPDGYYRELSKVEKEVDNGTSSGVLPGTKWKSNTYGDGYYIELKFKNASTVEIGYYAKYSVTTNEKYVEKDNTVEIIKYQTMAAEPETLTSKGTIEGDKIKINLYHQDLVFTKQ